MCSDLIWKGYDKADTLTFSAFVLVNCQVECTTDGETRVLQENIQENIRRYSKKTSDDTLRQCPMIENILLAPIPQKIPNGGTKGYLLCYDFFVFFVL